jgi:peptidoglycan/xylan/chitin deacetylase (PgdA/CDA1 family)
VKDAAKRWLLRALARLAREPGEGLAALTYHSIDESGSPVSFPVSFCRAQLGWLAACGYRALTARQAQQALSGEQPLPPQGIVLTFDDGFRTVRGTAFDLLSEFGFTATVFCASGYLGGRCGWQRAPGIPEFEMMDWDDVGFLVEQGWEVGGHTVTHARLPELPDDVLAEEIGRDRETLGGKLGVAVTSFAYPYGAYDARCVQAAAAAGFASAWTMQPRINRQGGEVLTLGRFNCDRVRADSPETAALAAQVCLGGRYDAYARLTARRLRVRRRPGGER